ncbi:MAG: M14 family metallopeptidase [Bacteroidetes bacterium]|nr:M14 family metallopeptidase [Bacteroidota bacterium]
MKRSILFFLFIMGVAHAQVITTQFERSGGTQSPDYLSIIDWWKKMDAASPYIKMTEKGMTDTGYPLDLVLISADKDFDIVSLKKKKKAIILINNGIHPGEPDGIDASMLLARDIDQYLRGKNKGTDNTNKAQLPSNVVLAIIPVYNIGGCLNRSANYRVDQNGPEEFGFRGNSQNLDLNRDMIKCDSKEARALVEIFHELDPDIFLDNHVSDGADYQHVMTLITTQSNKLGGVMGEYLKNEMEPALYRSMQSKGYPLVPYVNAFGDTPETGWPEFWDSPRYTSGYGALWSTFSFVPETHMLKPYNKRVDATYQMMSTFIDYTSTHNDKIRSLRKQTVESNKTATQFPYKWTLDKSVYKEIRFLGFTAGYKTSEVSGLPRLYYDRSKPFEKSVKIFNYYVPKEFVEKPKAYVIPQGWWKVIQLLKLNNVEMYPLKKDTTMEVEVYRIEEYQTFPRQYEMHHPNYDVKVSTTELMISFRKGDWYIPMNQAANRYLVETLEPRAEDSYFVWNFFDGILGQKEGYSGYAFEDIAAEYLRNNKQLQTEMENKRLTDTVFAKSAGAQLNYVYRNSPWFEPAYMRYPVYRLK